MNTKELAEIVNKQSLTLAEINQALAQITRNALILQSNSLTLHDSIKSLETTALAHDAQIDELIEGHKALQKEWQAYLRRLPPA